MSYLVTKVTIFLEKPNINVRYLEKYRSMTHRNDGFITASHCIYITLMWCSYLFFCYLCHRNDGFITVSYCIYITLTWCKLSTFCC